ncbi:MAG: hypothetical protein KBG29_11955 [Pseudomonadales bacterium]|jgi:hypothetical protein|nr:hypothetical protein [Pseudomonadales bacterium]
MSKPSVSPEQGRFIDDVASLLVPWGMPQTMGRIYGYLLLSTIPLGLDRIAADLEISRSSASVAARLLEKHTLVRRHGERGSKRVLYTVSDNFAGLFSERGVMLGALGALLQGRAAVVASGAAATRLQVMSRFYLAMREAMEAAIREFDADVSAGKVV